MEKCLTQSERQEKKTAIRYLRGELKERLDYLNGEPDNLCNAYQAIIESMQCQIGAKDVVKETFAPSKSALRLCFEYLISFPN